MINMEQIKLKDFVQNTLVEIAEGVHGANQQLRKAAGTSVFCLRLNRGDSSKTPGIEFDVAVSASKEGKDTSGFMVALVNLGGGAKAERTTGNEMAHRIKFEVGLSTNWG
jgi:hypothetical protein